VRLVVQTSVAEGRTVAVLTFTGEGLNGSSLADGRYTLTIHGSRVRDRFGPGRQIDADGDGLQGGARVETFCRLYAASRGDGAGGGGGGRGPRCARRGSPGGRAGGGAPPPSGS